MRNALYRKHHLLRAGPKRSARVSLFAFIFISLALLTLSRINHDAIETFRGRVIALVAPTLEVVSRPAREVRRIWGNGRALLAKSGELERLKMENRKLLQWKWRAIQLQKRVDAYAKLVQAVERPPLGFVTGEVISEGRGPFLRSVLLNTGREDGVKNGYPAVSAEGLAGRVVQTGNAAAHILLLTDFNSRIPVEVGKTRVRALLYGDNGPAPRLKFISKDAKLAVGDEVFTSGQGGLLPRGIRVGKVAISDNLYRVALHANPDKFEYLSVLFFDRPGVDIINSGKRPDRPQRLDAPVVSSAPGDVERVDATGRLQTEGRR